MPTVSVVIPTYNRAALVCQAVDSVLAQTYPDLEVIVVDDGSTDGTREALAAYGSRVRSVYQENAGETAARNAGIRVAEGDYTAFLDSDDLWLPTKLEKQVPLLASGRTAWVYCAYEYLDDRSGRTSAVPHRGRYPRAGWIAQSLLMEDFVGSPTPVVRRSVFDEVGVFAESGSLCWGGDWDMWLRIAARYPVAYVPDVLARYRVHGYNISQAGSVRAVHRSKIAVIERAVAFAPEVYGPVRRHALALQHLRTGNQCAAVGDLGQARVMFLKAVQLEPRLLLAYLRFGATFMGKRAVTWWIRRNRSRAGLPG